MALEGVTAGSRGKTDNRACPRGLLVNQPLRPTLQDWTKGRGSLSLDSCDVWRSTRRVEPVNGPEKVGAGFRGRLSPRSAGLASDLNSFGLGHRGSTSSDGDLQHAVLEVGADIACVYALGQVHAPPEVAEGAFSGVEMDFFLIELAPPLPRDGQHAAGERDVYVLSVDARELAPDHQVAASSEYVRGRHPGGRVGSAPLLVPGLEVLSHPGHLAHGVHESPERVSARSTHSSSLWFLQHPPHLGWVSRSPPPRPADPRVWEDASSSPSPRERKPAVPPPPPTCTHKRVPTRSPLGG